METLAYNPMNNEETLDAVLPSSSASTIASTNDDSTNNRHSSILFSFGIRSKKQSFCSSSMKVQFVSSFYIYSCFINPPFSILGDA